MNGVRALALISLVGGMVGLAGCEHVEWYRPGADEAAVEADIRECRRQAALNAQRYLSPTDYLIDRGSRAPPRCSWPGDRDGSVGLGACPTVGPYGTPLSPGGGATRRARLEDQLTGRCLRAQGYELTPVDEIEGRAADPG
jgi:hypothetical protein